jgi:hypothetical protein
MEYAQLIIVAILIEAIWENLKMIWENGKISVNRCGSLLLSIIICLLANIDIFPIVGIAISIPFVGAGLTGIIVARGANFVNDLFTRLNGEEKK